MEEYLVVRVSLLKLKTFISNGGSILQVHRTCFTKDQVKVLSFSDDKTVGLWDIATEEKITSFTEHTDYIRAGAASPISPDIILSGSYDHSLKLYDCRSNETVLTVNHGSPVESTLFLPSGGIFISAGGTEIKVWDIFNGGKLLANISQHHKTVTTLRLASNNSRLLSGSLDRHVKIYDISTFKVVHNIDFPNAVLSMGISENDDIIAVGMVDGVISIRKRETPNFTTQENKGLFKFAPDHIKVDTVDVIVDTQKGNNEAKCDKFLRKMEFDKALADVLKNYTAIKYPEKTVALLQEMLRRKVLHIAINGVSDKHIGALLKFLKKHIGDIRFTRVVIDTANVFIDVLGNKTKQFSEQNLWLYTSLQEQIKEEIEVCKCLSELEGAMGLLFAGAQVNSSVNNFELNDSFIPSSKAQKDIVIDV